MKRMLYKITFVFVTMPLLATSLQAQIKDITALRARIPMLRDSVEQAAVYAQLGMLYTNRKLDSCYYFGIRALDLARRIGNRTSEAEALNVLAFYYAEQSNFYLAYKYINESLVLFKTLHNDAKICEVTMNIGVLLSFEDKPEQALAYFREAYELSKPLQQDSIKPLVLINLALAEATTPNSPDVGALLDEAEQLSRKQGNGRFLAATQLAQNSVMYFTGVPPAQIIPRQFATIDESIRQGYEYFTAMGYLDLSNLYLPHSVDSAIHYMDMAIELTERTGYENMLFLIVSQAYDLLSQQQPVPQQAHQYSQRLLALTREKELQTEKNGVDYLQLVLREQAIAAEQAKLGSRRAFMAFLVILSLLALVSSLLILRLYRRKGVMAQHLKQNNEILEAQNKRLADNDAFHQKLISIMSHDLRQPLSSMLMMGEGGLVSQMTEEQRQYVFDQISQNARTSLQAMDGLVHWMKLNTIGLAFTPVPLNLNEIIRSAIAYNQAMADQKQITIQENVPDQLHLLAQEEMLLFINRNILSNALRHTPHGGQVSISVAVNDDHKTATVCISDSGNGIPADVLAHLFHKDRPESAHGGSGLALIICHEMMVNMGGQIRASNNDGGGASFFYTLPVADSANLTIPYRDRQHSLP